MCSATRQGSSPNHAAGGPGQLGNGRQGEPHRVRKPLSRRFWAFWGGWAESEAAGSLVAPELDPRRGRNTPGFGLLSEELDCLGGWRIEPGSGWRRAPTTTAPGSIWTDLVRPPRLRHLPADASSPGGRTSGPAKLDRPGGRTTDCAVRHHCPTSRGNTGLPADCPGRPLTYFRLGGRAFTRSATGRVWRPRRGMGCATPALVGRCPRFALQPHWSAQTTWVVVSHFGLPVMHTCRPAYPAVRQRLAAQLLGRPWHTGGSGRGGSDPPVRGPGTGSDAGVFSHPCPRPLGSLPIHQSLRGKAV